MSTLVPGPHPVLTASAAEQRAYLMIVASMVCADRRVEAGELARLEELCTQLDLAPSVRAEVRAATESPELVDIGEHLAQLRGRTLGMALLVDAVDIACADGVVSEEEQREIDEIALALDVQTGQVATIRRYVTEARGLAAVHSATSSEVAAGVAATAVPAAVLTVAAALGAPLAAGVGLAAALGVGGYMSVRWLARRTQRATTP